MRKKLIVSLLFCFCLVIYQNAFATTIVYQNDFESPTGIVNAGTYKDLTQQTVNSLYGPEFTQTNTVETFFINGIYNLYSDPSGTGGNHAIGMLSSVQDDKLALVIDTLGKDFINLSIDIAGVALSTDGTSPQFLTGDPTFNLSVYDSPAATPIFGGTLLSSTNISGVRNQDPFTFTWTNHVFGLSTAGLTNDTVSLVFDLTAGGYAAFDNLIVTVSDTQGDIGDGSPVPEPTTMILFGFGLLGLAGVSRKKQ